MRNSTYGGVRGRKTKVGRKLLRFPPTRLNRSLISFVQAISTQANLISSKNQETIRGQSGFSFLNHFLNHTF